MKAVAISLFASFWLLFAQSAEGGTENSMASSKILEFGDRGKRNMLYDVRQRPQAVLLHDRLYIVYNGDATPPSD